MPWIDEIDEDAATGELKDLYDTIAQRRGKLSNIMRVHSLHPGAMQAHMDLYLRIMFDRSELRREERELVAVVVSAANGCTYCVRHHAEALRAYWKDEERVRQAARDYRQLDLSERIRAMLAYASDLTRAPAAVDEAAVERLRAAGLSDRAILDINLVTSYFNFVNRIAEGLGVDVSEQEVGGYRY